MPDTYPAFRTVVIDATGARAVAELYRRLLGYTYRPGDEPPPPGQPDPQGEDWLALRDHTGEARLDVQRDRALSLTTRTEPAASGRE